MFAAGEILRVLRRGQGERQIAVLDRVGGLDLTVRAAALALRADVRTVRRRLVEALAVATENRKTAAKAA